MTLPSPGRILDEDGDVIPASYMNFYIGNAAVVVPQYGAPNDEAAVDVVQALFPDRVAIGLRADHILTGGGSFHCISATGSRMTKLTVAALQLAFTDDTAANIRAVSRARARGRGQGRRGRASARTVRRPLFLPRRGRGPVRERAAHCRASVRARDAGARGRAEDLDPDQLLRSRTARTITTASP